MQGEEWDGALALCRRPAHGDDALHRGTHRPKPYLGPAERGHGHVKRASELRLEAMDMCTATPSPASFFDWVVSIAPVNFLPGGPESSTYFESVQARNRRARRERRGRGQGREVPPVLRRHDELEQGRLARRQVRRRQCVRRRRSLYAHGILAGAAAHRPEEPGARHGAELPDLPEQPRRADHDRRDQQDLRTIQRRRHGDPRISHLPRHDQPAVPDRRCRHERSGSSLFFEGDVRTSPSTRTSCSTAASRR